MRTGLPVDLAFRFIGGQILKLLRFIDLCLPHNYNNPVRSKDYLNPSVDLLV